MLSWAGTRGVITLAAIFSLPLVTSTGAPFPGRDLLQFCAFVIVLVTLVGQGMTFGPLVRAMGLQADAADEARAASVSAALAGLDQITHDEGLEPGVTSALRTSLDQRAARYRRRLEALQDPGDGTIVISPALESALSARHLVIDVQREELLRWRDAGRLPDASLRILERELDHEEYALGPGAGPR